MIAIVIITAVLVFYLHLFMRRGNKTHEKTTDQVEDYLDSERRANLARAHPIETNLFITINESVIPKITPPISSQISRSYTVFSEASQKKMIIMKEKRSNREIKEQFGVSNFHELTQFEENFTNCMHTGNYYAEALYNEKYMDEAKKTLQLLIDSGSDISKTYTLFLDILADHPSKADQAYIEKAIAALPDALATRIRNHSPNID